MNSINLAYEQIEQQNFKTIIDDWFKNIVEQINETLDSSKLFWDKTTYEFKAWNSQLATDKATFFFHQPKFYYGIHADLTFNYTPFLNPNVKYNKSNANDLFARFTLSVCPILDGKTNNMQLLIDDTTVQNITLPNLYKNIGIAFANNVAELRK